MYTTIGKDKVKLVESMKELQIGMLIWVKPCSFCNTQHKFMLMCFKPKIKIEFASGSSAIDDVYITNYVPPCDPKHTQHCVGNSAIANKKVFRVIDDLKPEASPYKISQPKINKVYLAGIKRGRDR